MHVSQPQYPADPGQPGQQPAPDQPDAAASGAPAATPARGRARLWLIGALVLGLIMAGLAVVVSLAARDDAANAKVNDCLAGQAGTIMKKVDCAKAHDWKVVGRIGGRSATEFDENTCAGYQESTIAYWSGHKGKKGIVLCLAPAN
jgi:hypothetical protein